MILISTKMYSFVCVRVMERVLYLAFLYVASVKIAANDCMCEMDFIEKDKINILKRDCFIT